MPADPAAPLATIAAALRREPEPVGISLAELARRAGVAKTTLSQLESGTGNPSVETLWALGVALGVPSGRLVEPAGTAVQVIRAGEGPQVRSEQADFSGTLLSAGAANLRREVYLIRLEPGAIRTGEGHTPRSVEHGWCAGRLRVGPRWHRSNRTGRLRHVPRRRAAPGRGARSRHVRRRSSWSIPDRGRRARPGRVVCEWEIVGEVRFAL